MTAEPTERIILGTWPTPVERAPRLAAAIGLHPDDLWLKRDDLIGVGAGGNKIRKLEWTVAAALAEGADTLITTGAPQSNHARLTAAVGARLGLPVILVLPGTRPPTPTGNLLLDELFGAEIVWTGADAPVERANDVARGVADRGGRAAVIPFGGTNAIGAQGYRVAAREIEEQLPQVNHVVCAVGSGGTMAGLVAGLGSSRVFGVHVGAIHDPHTRVAEILSEMGEPADGLRIRTDQVGESYADLAPGARRALVTAAQSEGLVLDPVYTARAMAGLIAEIDDGGICPGQTVVFLASGGLPGLFGHPGNQELTA